jgi:hypothetical protein
MKNFLSRAEVTQSDKPVFWGFCLEDWLDEQLEKRGQGGSGGDGGSQSSNFPHWGMSKIENGRADIPAGVLVSQFVLYRKDEVYLRIAPEGEFNSADGRVFTSNVGQFSWDNGVTMQGRAYKGDADTAVYFDQAVTLIFGDRDKDNAPVTDLQGYVGWLAFPAFGGEMPTPTPTPTPTDTRIFTAEFESTFE